MRAMSCSAHAPPRPAPRPCALQVLDDNLSVPLLAAGMSLLLLPVSAVAVSEAAPDVLQTMAASLTLTL